MHKPCQSWSDTAPLSKLDLGRMVAKVEPNADGSAWLWEIRQSNARNTTAPMAGSFGKSVPTREAAKLEAETALRDLAFLIQRIVGGPVEP